MEKLILAIDQGTTATTVLVINKSLQIVAKESMEVLPTYPQAGWVEHDLNQIWEATLHAIKNILQNNSIAPAQIIAIGITNQRETVGAWSKKTMIPAAKAIVWQCRRTTDRCNELSRSGHAQMIKEKTGLVLDPYFSASKVEWFLKNIPGLSTKASNGEIAFGTIDSFLVYRMTCGAAHITDVSNASRTMLMDLKTLSWDQDLLKLFSIPENTLPEIKESAEIYGRTKAMQILPDGIPICGILGDQQAALFGQLCTNYGDTKCTYGTGSFLMCNTGKNIVYSQNGLLTTLAWKLKGEVNYALEGSVFVAGAAVQWLRDGLGIIKNSSEIESLACQAENKDMGDLVFVPALTGLGAPYWNAEARGLIYGITRGTNKFHLARATLEGIAHQNDDLFTAIREDLGNSLNTIKVDGGASANNFLMQYQSDLANVPLARPKILETTALGAAMAAGLAVGFWPDISALQKSWQLDETFQPQMDQQCRDKKKRLWKTAIMRVNLETKYQ